MVNFHNIHRETTENSFKNVINSQALTETKYDFKNDNARTDSETKISHKCQIIFASEAFVSRWAFSSSK